jgi:hypothetical protein
MASQLPSISCPRRGTKTPGVVVMIMMVTTKTKMKPLHLTNEEGGEEETEGKTTQMVVDGVEVAKNPKFLITTILALTMTVCKNSTLMRAAQGVSVLAV